MGEFCTALYFSRPSAWSLKWLIVRASSLTPNPRYRCKGCAIIGLWCATIVAMLTYVLHKLLQRGGSNISLRPSCKAYEDWIKLWLSPNLLSNINALNTFSKSWVLKWWSGRFLGIIGWDPRVCKSNWLHVDILRFFFIKLGYIL